ncbi:hypothetical protein GMRT_14684 [Giardia muris]|uniref:Coiled-coil protein n=1 Tax=Giardia muris TaxID=5742 RepID=A0A4Z1T1X9_GIAMU|nr:hypothetical protein GMRT_14684 [Giardia muris]|eukprot:TNJ26401.1 hypothetical protein GMRT_14684 [Giardia muris]
MSFNQWVQTYRSLAIQERNAVVALHTTLEHSTVPSLATEVHALRQHDIMAIAQRLGEHRRVTQQLSSLLSAARYVEGLVRRPGTPLTKVEAEVRRLEEHLSAARQGWDSVNQGMRDEEVRLLEEVQQALLRLQVGLPEDQSSTGTETRPRPTRVSRRDTRPYALQVVEEEMERIGGAEGGWDQKEHDRFFSLWLQSRATFDRRAFVQSIQRYFPSRTPAALLAHDEHVETYMNLVEKRKDIIASWKRRTQTGSTALETDTSISKPHSRTSTTVPLDHAEKLARWNERRLMEAEDKRSAALRWKWRQQREARIRREAQKQKKLEQEKKRLAEAELASQPVQPSFAEQQEARLQDLERRRRAKELQESLQRRQSIDLARAAEKHSRKLAQQQAEELRKLRLEKQAERARSAEVCAAKRDPGRLLRPNTAMRARMKELEEWKKAKEQTGQGLSEITRGFDPFALTPIPGARAPADWML